jgi:hypothetical protein
MPWPLNADVMGAPSWSNHAATARSSSMPSPARRYLDAIADTVEAEA